tara:strand:+ start:672 stop:1034 length:363 start_codon:yes stop_codon:yes gene_type:complete
MKTTRELIIEDITAKVEAKLAKQNVNLSLTLIDNLKKLGLTFESQAVELHNDLLLYMGAKAKLEKKHDALLKVQQTYLTEKINLEQKAKELGFGLQLPKELQDTDQIGKDVYGLYKAIIK